MNKRARLLRSGQATVFIEFASRKNIFSSRKKFSFSIILSQSFTWSTLITMSLLSSVDEQIFESLKDLIQRVNEHVASKNYAVMLLRIKKFKLDVKRKAWIICDRDDRLRSARDEERRHITSRCIECLFSLTAKRMNDENDSWLLKIVNDQHNHQATFVDSHSTQRKVALNAEIRNDISRQLQIQTKSDLFESSNLWRQLQIQTKSSQILSSLRILDSIDSSSADSENSIVINSMFKSRDIYNLKAELRRETLKSLTSIQALIRELDQDDWTYAIQKNAENHITHLFFVKICDAMKNN